MQGLRVVLVDTVNRGQKCDEEFRVVFGELRDEACHCDVTRAHQVVFVACQFSDPFTSNDHTALNKGSSPRPVDRLTRGQTVTRSRSDC